MNRVILPFNVFRNTFLVSKPLRQVGRDNAENGRLSPTLYLWSVAVFIPSCLWLHSSWEAFYIIFKFSLKPPLVKLTYLEGNSIKHPKVESTIQIYIKHS